MTTLRSKLRRVRAAAIAVVVALVVFAVVELVHTHAPWGPPPEHATLAVAGDADAGPGACPACRAAHEHGTSAPTQGVPAPNADRDAASRPGEPPARRLPADRAPSPRGPPTATSVTT